MGKLPNVPKADENYLNFSICHAVTFSSIYSNYASCTLLTLTGMSSANVMVPRLSDSQSEYLGTNI